MRQKYRVYLCRFPGCAVLGRKQGDCCPKHGEELVAEIVVVETEADRLRANAAKVEDAARKVRPRSRSPLDDLFGPLGGR